MTAPIDLLGRELSVGDHVIWQMGHGLGHGFITKIDQRIKDGKWLVTATKAPGSHKRGQTAYAAHFCKVVLP